MYTYTEQLTNNGITRIKIYLDGVSCKVIRNAICSKAIEQKDYYINMMRGVNTYTTWLNRSK